MIVFCHKLNVAFNDGPIKDNMTMIIKTILNFKKTHFIQSVIQVAHMKKYW